MLPLLTNYPQNLSELDIQSHVMHNASNKDIVDLLAKAFSNEQRSLQVYGVGHYAKLGELLKKWKNMR